MWASDTAFTDLTIASWKSAAFPSCRYPLGFRSFVSPSGSFKWAIKVILRSSLRLYYAHGTYRCMSKQARPERQSERFNMKASPEFLARLDHWRRKQPDLPNRSEAIRRLVDAGMKRKKGDT